jgi:hypothetical protein
MINAASRLAYVIRLLVFLTVPGIHLIASKRSSNAPSIGGWFLLCCTIAFSLAAPFAAVTIFETGRGPGSFYILISLFS